MGGCQRGRAGKVTSLGRQDGDRATGDAVTDAAQRRAPGMSTEPGRHFLTLALLIFDADFVDAGVVVG
jgi:hypothetical protein